MNPFWTAVQLAFYIYVYPALVYVVLPAAAGIGSVVVTIRLFMRWLAGDDKVVPVVIVANEAL